MSGKACVAVTLHGVTGWKTVSPCAVHDDEQKAKEGSDERARYTKALLACQLVHVGGDGSGHAIGMSLAEFLVNVLGIGGVSFSVGKIPDGDAPDIEVAQPKIVLAH